MRRRRFLHASLTAGIGLLLPRGLGWAAELPPTPACDDEGEPTLSQTAGPFYTEHAPAKADFRGDDPAGAPLLLRASVRDTHCRPVSGAIVDLWHADSGGRYDNQGFRLRGHQVTDAAGAVRFATIVPASYGWRTRHFHARIFGPGRERLLTTQLYFPGEAGNADDGLFRPELLMRSGTRGTEPVMEFTFVFPAA